MLLQRILRATLLLAATAAFLFAADITGTWTVTFDTQVGDQAYTFTFKQEGTKLTGKAKNDLAMSTSDITEGSVNGDDITFVENLDFQGMPLKITYKGKISGDEIKLTRNVMDLGMEEGTAKKSK